MQKSESAWHLPNEKIGTSPLINDHPNGSDSEFYLHIGTDWHHHATHTDSNGHYYKCVYVAVTV